MSRRQALILQWAIRPSANYRFIAGEFDHDYMSLPVQREDSFRSVAVAM
jgi:hypothetical protein